MTNKEHNYKIPPLQMTVTIYELIGENEYVAVLSHTFHGSTQEELYAIMNAHKETDSFFRDSFEGKFEWKNGIIHLINSEPIVSYP